MKYYLVGVIATAGLMVAASTLATEMPLLAKKNNCTVCHAVDTKGVGPAWRDVSEKYKGAVEFEYGGKKYPLVDGLILKISKGGAGNWGTSPMLANDPNGSKRADMAELVRFILGLSK